MRIHYGPIPTTDNQGNLVNDVTIKLYAPGTTTAIATPVYAADSGGSPLNNSNIPCPSGYINFYTDYPFRCDMSKTRAGGLEIIDQNIDIGQRNVWKRYARDFGVKFDGVTDDAAAWQNAFNAMPARGNLELSEGESICGSTVLLPQDRRGCSISGIGLPSNQWQSATTIRAKTGSGLTAIWASPEWYNNLANGDPGYQKDQAITLERITFWGGGFDDSGGTHDTVIETTAHTQYGLVIHGSNVKVDKCFFMSANLDGLLAAGDKARNGTTTISETHELWVTECGFRYTGRDGFHGLSGAQDNYVGRCKAQYCGRHGFCNDNGASAYTYDDNHPSRCGSDMFHVDSTWECNVHHNYCDAVGDFMDNVATPWRTATAKRYMIYAGGGADNCIHVDNNHGHTESTGGQIEPVVMLYLNGWCMTSFNSLRFQTTDASVSRVELGAQTAGIIDFNNVMHKPGGSYDSTSTI